MKHVSENLITEILKKKAKKIEDTEKLKIAEAICKALDEYFDEDSISNDKFTSPMFRVDDDPEIATETIQENRKKIVAVLKKFNYTLAPNKKDILFIDDGDMGELEFKWNNLR